MLSLPTRVAVVQCLATMINVSEAAKQAVDEADKRIEASLGSSDVGRAKAYVNQAIDLLRGQSGGYDPNTLAPDSARQAVVEFAKARLIGQEPQNTASYKRAAQAWSRTAAAEYHKQGHNIE